MKIQEEEQEQKKDKEKKKDKQEDQREQEEQDGFSEHSPGQRAPPSSASSLPKSDQQEHSQVELELKLLEALEIYPPSKLQVAGLHRHFVLYGLMEYLQKRFNRHFSADEVLQLLDRFFNFEMMKSDDEDTQIFNREDGFSLPQSLKVKEEQ